MLSGSCGRRGMRPPREHAACGRASGAKTRAGLNGDWRPPAGTGQAWNADYLNEPGRMIPNSTSLGARHRGGTKDDWRGRLRGPEWRGARRIGIPLPIVVSKGSSARQRCGSVVHRRRTRERSHRGFLTGSRGMPRLKAEPKGRGRGDRPQFHRARSRINWAGCVGAVFFNDLPGMARGGFWKADRPARSGDLEMKRTPGSAGFAGTWADCPARRRSAGLVRLRTRVVVGERARFLRTRAGFTVARRAAGLLFLAAGKPLGEQAVDAASGADGHNGAVRLTGTTGPLSGFRGPEARVILQAA